MAARALMVGALVLGARALTFPRTPWEPDELRFPFAVMVAIAVAASVVTAVAFAVAFDDEVAALLFSFSAAVLVHAPMARVDAVAWMFVALALAVAGPGRRRAALFGAFAAASVACRPELAVSALALLFAGMFLLHRDRRERFVAGVAFAVVALPFVIVPEDLPLVTGFGVIRFTLHPWGSKLVALPLLVCVGAGIRPLVREWSAKAEVLMWFALVHVAVGVAAVDPRDGVRWAVPALFFTALVAARGLRVLRARWAGAAVLCALSVWYAYPILRDRVTRPSPLTQALGAIPRDVVVLHDPGTRFAGGMPLDRGLRRYAAAPHVRLLHVADGPSRAPGATVYSRNDGDAYGKLTRNALRQISLIPLVHRYAPLRGVFGEERNEAGESWRWLAEEAELRVPGGGTIALRLPADAPIAFNDLEVNGKRVRVGKGERVNVGVGRDVFIRASRTFALPAPDTRTVAVQLVEVAR